MSGPASPPDGATPGGLGRRFLLGGVTLGAGETFSAAVNFAITIVIARVLGPEDFGLYAFVFAINEFFNIVGAFSLQVALIQAKEAGQNLFDTAFALCGGLGAIGLLGAALVAPWLWWHHSPVAAWMLLAMAGGRILRLLSQVPQARLERDLRYGPITVISMVTSNVPNLCAVGFAWIGMGAWSLVSRDVLATLLLLAISQLWSGYRFRARLDRESLRRLWTISRKLFTAVGISILLVRIDRVAIGAFLGNAATGLYQQARFLSEAGSLAVRPLSRLALNLYARVQDDPARRARSHELINTVLARLMLAGAVVLLTFPSEVIRLLLGEEWLEAAPLLRIFGLYGALAPLIENVRVLFYGTGRVERSVRIELLQGLVIVPGVLWACAAGSLAGVATTILVSSLAAYAASWYLSRDLVERKPGRLFAVPVAVAAATVAAFAALGEAGVLAALPWWALPFLPPPLYAAALLAIERSALVEELVYVRRQLTGSSGGPAPVRQAGAKG